tara:strand:+ start:619 stop:1086 length:468 start_codon:yes stop_codon:yes gene_type:complete
MSKRVNKIIGLINEAHKDNKTELSSIKVDLAKAQAMLREGQDLGGNVDFFEDRFKQTEKRGLDALQTLDESASAARQISEEADNQFEDAKSLVKEATALGNKLDKIAQTLMDNDLDAKPVMAEMKMLEDVFGEAQTAQDRAQKLGQRVNKFLSKL